MDTQTSLLATPAVAKDGTERQSLLLEDDEDAAPPSPAPLKTEQHASTKRRKSSLIKRISLRRNKAPATLGLLAARTLKIAVYHGYSGVDKLEQELEAELEHENKAPSRSAIGRLRHQGEHQLHNKVVLVLVIVLNIIDCLLVMGELILDFHHVSHHLKVKLDMLESFMDNMREKYSPDLDDIPIDRDHSSVLLQTVLNGQLILQPRRAASNLGNFSSKCQLFNNLTAGALKQVFNYLGQNVFLNESEADECLSTSSDWNMEDDLEINQQRRYHLTADGEMDHTLIVVAHKMHYISITILAILVVLLLLKIFCAGKRFFKSRIQVFDGLVVVISFIIDLVFVKGLTIFDVDEFVIILTLLLPWRILRVLNSLVVAVLDKQRLNLKIIYTQKKKISRSLSETKTKVGDLQKQIENLQLQLSKGGVAPESEVTDGGSNHKTAAHQTHHMHLPHPHLPHPHLRHPHLPHPHLHHHHHNHQNGPGNHTNGLSSLTLSALAYQTADTFAPVSPTSPVSEEGLFSRLHQDPSGNGVVATLNGDARDDVASTMNGYSRDDKAATLNGNVGDDVAPTLNGYSGDGIDATLNGNDGDDLRETII